MMIPREEGFPHILHPRFVDGGGRLYDQEGRSRGEGPPDSTAVIRFDRASGAVDTVATIWLPPLPSRPSRRFGYLPKMLEARDDWAVGPDGRVAVVRAADFSIEWTFPDGRRVLGPPQAFEASRVSGHDKENLLAEMRTSGISTTSVATSTGGIQQMAMSRGLPDSGDGPQVDDFEWAESFPAFRNDRTLISPSGEAWVQRWLPENEDSRWEVFDEWGIRLGSVVLPPHHQLIGFGRTPAGDETAYMVRADEYDLKWLERYRVVR